MSRQSGEQPHDCSGSTFDPRVYPGMSRCFVHDTTGRLPAQLPGSGTFVRRRWVTHHGFSTVLDETGAKSPL